MNRNTPLNLKNFHNRKFRKLCLEERLPQVAMQSCQKPTHFPIGHKQFVLLLHCCVGWRKFAKEIGIFASFYQKVNCVGHFQRPALRGRKCWKTNASSPAFFETRVHLSFFSLNVFTCILFCTVFPHCFHLNSIHTHQRLKALKSSCFFCNFSFQQVYHFGYCN